MKLNNKYGGQCIYCGKYKAMDYSIHGRGKNQIINYFHSECYKKGCNESAGKEAK